MAVRIEKMIYGGSGLAHDAGGATLQIPFTLPGEMVEPHPLRVLSASSERVSPRCPHFGACGGCQYQHASYAAQLRLKQEILLETMQRASVTSLPAITARFAEPWGYRNRIRLRIARVDSELCVGYSERASNRFLPIVACPIATPLLWRAAEALLGLAQENATLAAALDQANEVELFSDADEQRLTLTLHIHDSAPRGKARMPRQNEKSFAAWAVLLAERVPQLRGASVVRSDPRSGRVVSVDAEWGQQGLAYKAAGESFWISRGGFFQVNRFLIDAMVDAVCNGRSGQRAWDLFAGVGLFSRVLARSFAQVTAVEANPTAAADLAAALRRLGPAHMAVQQTTIDYLRHAVLQRERPDLIVLDPPRAGAGSEVCALLGRLAAPEMIYVSCDPTTLARDLRQLLSDGYAIRSMQMFDLFPQTFHLETITALTRCG